MIYVELDNGQFWVEHAMYSADLSVVESHPSVVVAGVGNAAQRMAWMGNLRSRFENPILC